MNSNIAARDYVLGRSAELIQKLGTSYKEHEKSAMEQAFISGVIFAQEQMIKKLTPEKDPQREAINQIERDNVEAFM